MSVRRIVTGHDRQGRAIIQEDARARRHVARHAVVVRCYLGVITFNSAGGDDELLIREQHYRLMVLQRAGANFRPREIDENCQRPVRLFRRRACRANIRSFFFLRAMRHVYAHAVHTCHQHGFKYLWLSC